MSPAELKQVDEHIVYEPNFNFIFYFILFIFAMKMSISNPKILNLVERKIKHDVQSTHRHVRYLKKGAHEPWICTFYLRQDLSLFLHNVRAVVKDLCLLIASLYRYLVEKIQEKT